MVSVLGFQLFSGKNPKEVEGDGRPTRGFGEADADIIQTTFPILGLGGLYDYAFYSDTIRTIHEALNREIFRNGGDYEACFVRKCTNEICRAEFDYETEKCDECGQPTRKPDHLQKWTFDEFKDEMNINGQTLIELSKVLEIDADAVDNAYLLALKKYTYTDDGKILAAKVLEFVRGDPRIMKKIIDKQGRPGFDWDTGRKILICPEHRTKVQSGPRCMEKGCNKMLYPAYFKTDLTEKPNYYLAGEVCHRTKYTHTVYYGFPPMLTLLPKIQTLLAQDKYMRQYYYGKKSPKGILTWVTGSVESAKAAWNAMVDRSAEEPNNIFPLYINPGANKNAEDVVQFVDLMRTPDEMKYIEVRQELIMKLGAFYGVMPVFQADLSQSSGLNSEGLQMTVTSRAIEVGQGFHHQFYDFMAKQLGMYDYRYRLNPNEDKDEMSELQVQLLETQVAQAHKSLGFEVEKLDDGKFKYTKKEPQANPFAGEPIPEFGQEEEQPDLARPDGEPMEVSKKKDEDDFESALNQQIEKFAKLSVAQRNLAEFTNGLRNQMLFKFNKATDRYFSRIYREQIIKLEGRLGLDLGMSKVDEDALHALKNQTVLSEAYTSLSREIGDNINKAITEAYSKGSPGPADLRKIVLQVAETSRPHAELIARTESSKVQSAAHMVNYKKAFPEGFKVRHAGPTDDRTTPVCKKIMERTKNGVTPEEYVKVIEDETRIAFPKWKVDPNAPLAHYSCRHRPEVVV